MNINENSFKKDYLSNKFFSKISSFVKKGTMKLKSLSKDSFEKEQVIESSSNIKNKTNKLPNSIGGLQDDFSGNIGHEAKFYPEDIKKMEQMTIEEKQNYIAELLKNGKFIDVKQS